MKRMSITNFPPANYAANEAINTLCTNLSFVGKKIKKIMITSCHAGEGKSYVSMHLMRAMARLGKRTVLIDADLRRSVADTNFGLQFENGTTKSGLSHFLSGNIPVDDVIYQTNFPNAFIVPVGKTVSTPLSLLVSDQFDDMINCLAHNADYVLVDAPPVGIVIDAAEIAKSCDGILLVVDYNAVHRQELIESVNQLKQTGCPILGTVLNQVDYEKYNKSKYYGKHKYYGGEHKY